MFYSKYEVYVAESELCVRRGDSLTRINLEECFRNFAQDFRNSAHKGSIWKCVGTRDITTWTYVFWTQPPFELSFAQVSLFRARRSRIFRELQRQLYRHGYVTYDMS